MELKIRIDMEDDAFSNNNDGPLVELEACLMNAIWNMHVKCAKEGGEISGRGKIAAKSSDNIVGKWEIS